MPSPSDWPRRWWLRQGDVAAVLKLPGRPSTDVIFTGDDLTLWDFRIDGQTRTFIWDHSAHAFASGPEDDPALNEALREVVTKLMGRPWVLTPQEQTIVDLIASDFAKTVEVSGKRLRFRLQQEFKIDRQQAQYYLARLQDRYVFRIDGEGDSYRLTLPGLFVSSAKDVATKAVESTLSALREAFKRDQDFKSFGIADVLAPGFTSEEAQFWRHTVARAALGTSYNNDLVFNVPSDIEHLVGCTTVADLWRATAAAGDQTERSWPTAPMRLKETIYEEERRTRVGETSRPPTRGAGQLDAEERAGGDVTVVAPGNRAVELDRVFREGIQSARQPGPARLRAPRPPAMAELAREPLDEDGVAIIQNARPVPVSETTAAGPPSPSMLVKLAREVAKVLRPEPQASIGFGLIQSTYYDEKTGKLMAKVVPDPSRPGKVSLGTFQPGGRSSERRMKYDAALSFAGEDRHYAEELKTIVKAAGFEIFYDNDEESALWGENVYDVLYDVYANQSRFVVMFVSEHYARKEWTTHERQAAQSTALKKKGKAYILPVYIDKTQLPGLHGTIGRQDISKGIPHIARMLIEKLQQPSP